MGKEGSALNLCNEILNTKLNQFENLKLQNRIERVKELKKELLIRLNSSK